MPQVPHRPYVAPRPTNISTQAVVAGDFHLPRPFVPGAAPRSEPPVRDSIESVHTRTAFVDSYIPPVAPVLPEPLPPIAEYLSSNVADSAAAAAAESVAEYEAEVVEDDSYELPPIEHFTDTVPDEMLEGRTTGNGEESGWTPSRAASAPESGVSEWEETDWQQYDWRSAAALGDGGDPEASSAWAETDWDNAARREQSARETPAKAIADALDGIARRIREGELVIPPPGAITDPAAIAATLAALLGVRR